jgi:hypothetical protein
MNQEAELQQQLLAQRQQAAPAVFSLGDANRLLNAQQALSALDSEYDNGNCTDEDYQAARAPIQQQVDGLQQKQRMFQAHQQRQATARGIAQNATETATQMAGLKQRALAYGSPDGSPIWKLDPNDQNSPVAVMGPDGKVAIHERKAAGAGGTGTSEVPGLKAFDPAAAWEHSLRAATNKETGQVDVGQAEQLYNKFLDLHQKKSDQLAQRHQLSLDVKAGLKNPDGSDTLKAIAQQQTQLDDLTKQAVGSPQAEMALIERKYPVASQAPAVFQKRYAQLKAQQEQVNQPGFLRRSFAGFGQQQPEAQAQPQLDRDWAQANASIPAYDKQGNVVGQHQLPISNYRLAEFKALAGRFVNGLERITETAKSTTGAGVDVLAEQANALDDFIRYLRGK